MTSAAHIKRIGALVTGRVQGVGYRYFTEDAASRFSLTGWVANRFDGSVELEAQGAEEALTGFLARLRQGPQLSYVKEVRVNELSVAAEEKVFEIR